MHFGTKSGFLGVEGGGRRGAARVRRRQLRGSASARPLAEAHPQPVSSSPLIEPDVRISRIRLSDRFHVGHSAQLRFGLHVELLLELFELCRGCQAHANLPLVHSLSSTLNQGPFPPRSLPASPVLWAPPTPVRAMPFRHVRSSPRSHRPPVLRTPPLHACRAHYPGGPPGLVDCFHLALRPSPLLGRVGAHVSPLGTCSGFTHIAACALARPPFRGLLLRGFGSGSRPPSPPDGFRGASTIPRAGLSPASESAPFTAHPKKDQISRTRADACGR